MALRDRLDRRDAWPVPVLFVYGAQIYIWLFRAPRGDEEVYVVAKQWMWKVEHPGGQREIDALHVPVDKTIELVMASEDVIHGFFVPAFRLKHDVRARHLRDDLVQGAQAGRLPALVHAILRRCSTPR